MLEIETNMISIREKSKENKSFEFEKILGPYELQAEIYEVVKEGIEKLGNGGNVCIMAYGQTGSGKTFTMNFLISQAILRLAEIISSDYEVSLQCIEVYNEQLKNLLSDEPLSKNWKEVLGKSEVKLDNNWKNTS